MIGLIPSVAVYRFAVVPRWVGVRQGIVVHIRVAVQRLQLRRVGDDAVARQEAAELRIVDPRVHVDEAGLVEFLVAGVAARGEGGLPEARGHPARERGPSDGAAITPGVEGVARLHIAWRVGDDIGRAEMVVQHVDGLRGGRLQHHRRAADIGLMRDRGRYNLQGCGEVDLRRFLRARLVGA